MILVMIARCTALAPRTIIELDRSLNQQLSLPTSSPAQLKQIDEEIDTRYNTCGWQDGDPGEFGHPEILTDH